MAADANTGHSKAWHAPGLKPRRRRSRSGAVSEVLLLVLLLLIVPVPGQRG
jgi:hypothetical protein